MTPVGIDALAFYTSPFYLDLAELAIAQGQDRAKYYEGIGQEKMSIMPPDEDVVTLGANAAKIILENENIDNIKTVLFATETGIDQSKSAGIFAHRLLGLKDDCRIIELKQACYSSTFAVQMARMIAQETPSQKVLIISSDNARYEANSPGEATQGCGAIAMLISANPRILELSGKSATYTGDVMDFWRPNYRNEAIVDGKYSTKVYLNALQECSKRYHQKFSCTLQDISHLLFHLPFTRIAEKALKLLFRHQPGELAERINKAKSSLVYNRLVGNSYTASLYIALCSLLDNHDADLSEQQIGLFSYGSGFSAEFFSGTLVKGYKDHLKSQQHKKMFEDRKELDYKQYIEFYNYQLPEDGGECNIDCYTTGHFRLARISNHKRIYEESKS